MNELISIKNLYMKYSKRDKNFTLKNLNFNVNLGEFHAFIGENGAGKSTTIRILVGLNNEYDGEVKINNLDAKLKAKARDGICYIPDRNTFPNDMSVFQFLYDFALLVRDDKEKLKMEINDLLKKYEIMEMRKRNPNKLSTGQKKKVLLIKAIIERSELIILDEPAANLDPPTRYEMFEILKQLNKQGVTILISSHILEEIKNYIDSVTFIRKGEIKWSGLTTGDGLIKKYETFFLGQNQDSIIETNNSTKEKLITILKGKENEN